jgi:hypothetical protein
MKCDIQHIDTQHNGSCTVMLSVANKLFMLNVVMLSIVMLNVVAPNKQRRDIRHK